MKSKFNLSKAWRRRLFLLSIVLAVVLIVLLFGKALISISTVVLLMAIGIASLAWKRLIRVSLGFELILLPTVLFAVSFDAFFGVVAAIIMTFVANFIAGRVCMPMFVQMMAYAAVAIFASFMPGKEIVLVGKISVILFNVILHVVYVFLLRFRIENSIMSFIINAVVNFYLFTLFSNPLMMLLNS